jgi:hypothetical protein
VAVAGGSGGDAQAAPDDGGADDVGEGLDGVGNQGVGVANIAGDELDDGEGEVSQQAGEGEALGAG